MQSHLCNREYFQLLTLQDLRAFSKTIYMCHLLSTVWCLLWLSKYFTHSIKPLFRAYIGWVSVRVQELERGGNTREYKIH